MCSIVDSFSSFDKISFVAGHRESNTKETTSKLIARSLFLIVLVVPESREPLFVPMCCSLHVPRELLDTSADLPVAMQRINTQHPKYSCMSSTPLPAIPPTFSIKMESDECCEVARRGITRSLVAASDGAAETSQFYANSGVSGVFGV